MSLRSRFIAVLSACALLAATLPGTAMAAKNPANPLITDRGQSRPLIVITPRLDDAAYQRMREQLQRYRDALAQRRTVLYSIENGNGQRSGRPMTRFETRALLDAMQVSPQGPMTVILVGLDGGKKMQLEGYVDPQQILDIVDNIPVRQASDPASERERQ